VLILVSVYIVFMLVFTLCVPGLGKEENQIGMIGM
jgi:hypothetical protein